MAPSPDDEPTPAQLRAARAFLNLSIVEAGERAGVSPASIAAVERGRAPSGDARHRAIRSAYEAAGIRFLGGTESGPGLILRPRPAAPERDPSSSSP